MTLGGIVEVHCSDVEKWYKIEGSKKIEARYEELTISERYNHGGPWMSVETCAIRINNLLTNRQYPLVAEINGNIVGGLELILGFDSGILHDTAFIDVMVVHRQYRRGGVASSTQYLEVLGMNNRRLIVVIPIAVVFAFML